MNFPKIPLLACAFALAGCVSELNSIQKQEYASMEAANVLVEEKSTTAGAWFGLLPGGGSFYSREPGMGVVNLLTWPLSMFWDPVNGYEGARYINYNASRQRLRIEKQREHNQLYGEYTAGMITESVFKARQKMINQRYDTYVNGYLNDRTGMGYMGPSMATSMPVAPSQSAAPGAASKKEWQQAQLKKLAQDDSLSYEEYKARYEAIMKP